MMGRRKQEPTRHIRVKVSLLSNLRSTFPNVTTDGDRVASALDFYSTAQIGINKMGSFVYGKRNWKKIVKK